MRTGSILRLDLALCSNALSNTASPPSKAARVNQTLSLADGRNLGYAEYGCPTGFPLLYFHGFPSSRLEGSALDGIARRQGLRVVCPDRPGYGQSTFQPNRRILDWASDVQSLADHLRLPRFAVLGGSGGGPYSLACAHSLPHDRLSAVGIFAGAGPWSAGLQYVSTSRKLLKLAATKTPATLRIMTDGLVQAARWALSRESVARQLDDWVDRQESDEESRMSTKEGRQMVVAVMSEAFAQGSAAAVQEAALLSHDWGFRFEEITYDKIQIWHGEKDANSPIEMTRYMAQRLPHCSLREYPGETHFTIGRHFEEVLSELVPERLIQKHLTT
ncbi:Alpha/Beta hydrolase protein [Aspergillus egyptiacus]|nr:Alpha/Beta hydrolase protein [Aspergillus egyptiacus]